MSIAQRFQAFAADFEVCVADDRWERLENYLAEDAIFVNAGTGDAPIVGKAAIVDYFRRDVSGTDRRFDSRRREAVTEPKVDGNRLRRRWRCTYTLTDAPDLVVEGEARYEFQGDLIQSMEQRLAPDALQRYVAWMEEYGALLHDPPGR